MKNAIFIMIIFVTIFLASVYGLIDIDDSAKKKLQIENSKYENYLGKSIQGIEVTSMLNQAMDQNEKNHIPKDNKNYYIEDNENSIVVIVKITSVGKEYRMEEIVNHDINGFIENFNTITFQCTDIQYHESTGKIKRIIIEEK